MITHKTAMEKAALIVGQMTLEERASQLRYDAPAIPRLGIPSYNWWSEALHGVARAGTATVFPQAIGLAAMFSKQLQYEIASVISTEGRAKFNAFQQENDHDIYKGLTFWSPNVNIFRDPRWGRGQETYGEDPYLTSALGTQFVRGLQGDSEYLKSAACAKHYAVHSGPEPLRHQFDAKASKKDMRETYLYAFEKLVKDADVESVMGSYNRVNGEPACASRTLADDILRGEWGFEGHFVSDCWAISDFHKHHHVTDTAEQSAALAMKHGCDLNCGNTYLHIMIAYKEGLITEEQITLACTRLMATRIRLGLFDENCAFNGISPLENDTDEHNLLAREAARKSMVLLKNNGVLPLDLNKISTIGVIGPNADSQKALEGNYNGQSSRYVTFLQGVRGACEGKARVLYALGSQLYKKKDSGLSACEDDRIAEAVAVAKLSDAVILCVGLDATLEGEEGDTGNQYYSGDKNDLELPEAQRTLIDAVLRTGTRVITVLAAGSAMRVEEGDAVICAWYPGQAGGDALCDLVFGKASPSGKLPVTFYRNLDGLPEFTDYAMPGHTYRYFEGEALYPFGFGLSYTMFDYSDARYENGAVTVHIRNAGAYDADEIAEVYIGSDSAFAPPHPALCGFERVSLKAGEDRDVVIALNPDAFTVVNDEGERVPVGGAATLYVGGSQPDGRSVELVGAKPLEIEIEP